MATLRKNFIYSTMLVCANYLFPLAVYPYVSRVLGVAEIGLVSFIDSIATYFILFSMMGISILGIREVASASDDRERLGEVFRSLLVLNGLVTIVALVAMVAATLMVPQLRDHADLMGIGMCKLIFNMFLIEWFWRGLEEFRYITLRTIAIKILYVVSVFIFVRDPVDTPVYYFLTMTVVVANAVVNMSYASRFVSVWKGGVSLRRFLAPFFKLGLYMLLSSAYTTLNVAFLGFVSDDTEVGYYTTATKLFGILLTLIMSVTNVMIPRMTMLASGSDGQKMRVYARRVAIALILFSLPLTAVVEWLAPEIVWLLSGPGYEGAIFPVRIIVPFFAVFGLGQLVVVQVLTPLGDDRGVTWTASVGAAVGVALNLLLVPRFGAVGSSVVWVSAETAMLLFATLYLRKQYPPSHAVNYKT